MNNIKQTVIELTTILGPKVGISIVVLLSFWLLANVAKRTIIKIFKQVELNAHLSSLLARTAKIALIIFGVITVIRDI